MKKLFVVTTNPTTVDQDKSFQEWIAPRFAWWHWMNQTWLLVDPSGQYDASEIRDKCQTCFPQVYTMVIEITSVGVTWSGFGPNNETNNMFDWIQRNWNLD